MPKLKERDTLYMSSKFHFTPLQTPQCETKNYHLKQKPKKEKMCIKMKKKNNKRQ